MTKRRIDPSWSYSDKLSYSHAIECDGWLFVSGLVATGPGHVVLHPGNMYAQLEVIYERLEETLVSAGCSFDDVVSTREYITDVADYKKTAEIRKRHFSSLYPAAVGVVVVSLLQPGALIELEAVARCRM